MRLDQIDRLVMRQHGVTASWQLTEMGLTDSQISRLRRAQRWCSPVRGIYHSPTHTWGRLQLMVAACLAQEHAAVAFTTAGQELGYRGMGDRRVHILVPHRLHLTLPGVVVHRCRKIDPVDVTSQRLDGVRLTSPPRTLLDAASIIGRDRTESAIEQALAERRCTLDTLMSTARRLHHPRRPGAKVFLEILQDRPVWRRAARSDLERVVLKAISDHGLPEPVVNMPYRLRNGEPIEIDLAWTAWKVAAEVDHPFWHDGVLESARDKRRDRKLAAEGWQTPRLTERDINESLDEVIEDLADILVACGWVRPDRTSLGA